MQRDGQARLDFIQNMSYKFVELLSCNFARSPDELVRQQITYRYNALKVRARGPVRAGGGVAGGTRESEDGSAAAAALVAAALCCGDNSATTVRRR